MTRFALTVEFDGRPFMGWQRQDHGPSVQQAIEEAAFAVTGEAAVVHAAGRTDAGVHGLGMRAHLDIAKPITPFRLMEALNAKLRPAPVAILACETVAGGWHARFSCVARHYEYRIVQRRAPLTWEKGLAWRIANELDVAAMAEGAARLVGRHDFTTFRSAHCQADSPLRTLDRLDVSRYADEIVIEASARSFLHNQVRSMVGSLKLVGEGKWRPAELKAALDARDRAACGPVAAACGLYLARVDYDVRSNATTEVAPDDD